MPDEILDLKLGVISEGRKYPLQINANEEQLVREATKQVRQKFIAYKQAYSKTDYESDIDLMTMMVIDLAVSHLQLERNNDKTSFITKIHQLDEKLKDYLKEQ